MIGEYKGTVKNKVVTALLQAYHDTLDYDGMKSILKEAGLLYLKDSREIDPNGTIDFFSFKKILAAQNCLLYYCRRLLFEIGKKFSFYLYPFGKDFEEIVRELTELIDTDWKVKIIDKSENSYVISVENCVFCSEIGVSCDLFKGFLLYSLEKTFNTAVKVYLQGIPEDVKSVKHNYFNIKLFWKKKET